MKIEETLLNRANNLNSKFYTSVDKEKFVKRYKHIASVIKKKGWCSSSIFRVCIKDGHAYLIDGQGRRAAIKYLTENDIIDFTKVTFNVVVENVENISFIGTEGEIKYAENISLARSIQCLNQCADNWKSNDLVRSEAVAIGEEECTDSILIRNEILEELGCGDYVANLIAYDEAGSHACKDGTVPKICPNKDFYFSAFKKLFNCKENPNKFKNSDFAILIASLIRSGLTICRIHRLSVEEVKKTLDTLIDKVCEIWDTDCENQDKYFSGINKKEKKISFYTRMKKMGKFKTKKSLIFGEIFDEALNRMK